MSAWTITGYTEGHELGRGAGGVVRLATHDATGQLVAVKYLSDALLADDGFRAGFRQEAELLGRIDAPNVVRLYEYVETSSGAAIVMELVNGVSLRAMLELHGPTEPESALSVLKGSLTGLGAAHAVGIVHRDFKPENVLVDASGQSKLTDFGISARAGEGGAEGGTPLYMAPEQWHGTPPEPRGDIYSATATFVECLTGRPPFDAPTLPDLRQQHEQAPVPVDGLPEPIRELALRGMAKDPAQRPVDAFAFLTELTAAAVAGYGEDWEERGREGLARRASLLALLFPILGGGLAGGTAIAETRLGSGVGRVLQRNRAPLAVGIATVLAIGAGAALALGPTAPQPESVPVETVGTFGPPQVPAGPVPEPIGPVTGGTPAVPPPPAPAVPPAAVPAVPPPAAPPAPVAKPPREIVKDDEPEAPVRAPRDPDPPVKTFDDDPPLKPPTGKPPKGSSGGSDSGGSSGGSRTSGDSSGDGNRGTSRGTTDIGDHDKVEGPAGTEGGGRIGKKPSDVYRPRNPVGLTTDGAPRIN
jgi:serine/threonine-protein kinase